MCEPNTPAPADPERVLAGLQAAGARIDRDVVILGMAAGVILRCGLACDALRALDGEKRLTYARNPQIGLECAAGRAAQAPAGAATGTDGSARRRER